LDLLAHEIAIDSHDQIIWIVESRCEGSAEPMVARDEVKDEIWIVRAEAVCVGGEHRERHQLMASTFRVAGNLASAFAQTAGTHARLRAQVGEQSRDFISAVQPALKPRVGFAHVVKPAAERQVSEELLIQSTRISILSRKVCDTQGVTTQAHRLADEARGAVLRRKVWLRLNCFALRARHTKRDAPRRSENDTPCRMDLRATSRVLVQTPSGLAKPGIGITCIS
jgi:hypothetical protein